MVSSKKTSWDLTVPSLIVLQWSHAKGALLSWRSDPFWENWIVGWVLAPPHWPMQPPMPCAQTCPTQVPARPMVAIGIGLTLLWVTLWECGRFQLLWIVDPSTYKSFATDFFNMQMTKKSTGRQTAYDQMPTCQTAQSYIRTFAFYEWNFGVTV